VTKRRRMLIRTQQKNGKRLPPKWTGFAGKTLWDWLQLLAALAIPVAIALGTAWFSYQQNQTSLQISERQHESDQAIALDQQRETTLKTYLDDMSDLLLNHNLSKSQPGDAVREVAKTRTLTTLRRLDTSHNILVFQFLQEANLISNRDAVITFHEADLRRADIGESNLYFVDFSWAYLQEANLSRAYLFGANLSDASLFRANLRAADLSRVNLSEASLLNADLSLTGLSGTDLSGADLRGANLYEAVIDYGDHRTILQGARYNTKEILWRSEGKILYIIPPTQWPQGFDPKAAGAIEDNTDTPFP
jgi:uncharacterized protein YjbI with pentapeptide repeats